MTNFTNNFELNKAHHDSFFKKAPENDIVKGGEGSRGGKIIGHTESGKPIYENHDHPAHKNFTSNDHTDAVYAHVNLTSRKSLATKEEKKKHLEEGKKHGASSHTAKQDPDSLDKYKQEEDKAKNKGDVGLNVWKVNFKHHKSGNHTNSTVRASNQKEAERIARERLGHSDEHKVISAFEVPDETPYERGKKEAEAQAKLTPEERKAKREKDANWTGNEVYRHFKNSLKKSEEPDSLQKAYEILGLGDLIQKGEGSKGGKVIGHTKSGKPIYAKNNIPVKGSSQYHQIKEGKRSHQEWEENHKDFTKEDHMDAAEQLHKKGKKNNDEKLLIEASNHSVYANSK